MHVSRHDDSSSLFPITPVQARFFRGTDEVRTETVRIGTLSEFLDSTSIDQPALLKLDVQGYELEVLRGCEELLDWFSYVSAVGSFVELYEGRALAEDLIQSLRNHGYSLVCVYGAVTDELGARVSIA